MVGLESGFEKIGESPEIRRSFYPCGLAWLASGLAQCGGVSGGAMKRRGLIKGVGFHL